MKIEHYGPGDEETWGGKSPRPTMEEELREKIEEEISGVLYDILYANGFHDLYEPAVNSKEFDELISKRITAMNQEEEC